MPEAQAGACVTRRQAVRRRPVNHEVDYWLIVGEPAPRPRVWLNVLYGLVVVGFVVLAVWLAVGRG